MEIYKCLVCGVQNWKHSIVSCEGCKPHPAVECINCKTQWDNLHGSIIYEAVCKSYGVNNSRDINKKLDEFLGEGNE
jgi:hypothetical protein